MSLASNPTPKSREGSLLLPAVRLTVWREFGQVLQREHVMGYLLVLPAVLLLVGLVAYPFVIALWLSLTDAYVGRGGDFIGLTDKLDYLAWLGVLECLVASAPQTEPQAMKRKRLLRSCWRRTFV